MKDNYNNPSFMNQLISNNQITELSKKAKLNQLSVEKIKNLVSESIFKKSASLANLDPFMISSLSSKSSKKQEIILDMNNKSKYC